MQPNTENNQMKGTIYMEVALRAARAAGEIIRRDFGKPKIVGRKVAKETVTATDLEAEKTILTILREAFPSHDTLAEEETAAPRSSEFRWIVDPMDGTTNFTHSYPFVAVSIGLEKAGEGIAGVVYDPLRDEMFAGEKGRGSTINGAPLRVSEVGAMGDSLLCTGFPYRLLEKPGDTFPVFQTFALRSEGVRRDGSAALDLCYVAAGRLDGFWERELKPWDTAAAALILREAGGRASDFRGAEFNPFMHEIVASNGRIHGEMLEVLQSAGGR
jgi:myo-inositol-1(or 4)-monophosphatase